MGKVTPDLLELRRSSNNEKSKYNKSMEVKYKNIFWKH